MTGCTFANAVLFALLLYSRSCIYGCINPAIFCDPNNCGWTDKPFHLPAGKVEYWDSDCVDFPLAKKLKRTIKRIGALINRLSPDSVGAFFVPTLEPTFVVGIFRSGITSEYRILLFQTVGWARKANGSSNLITKWRNVPASSLTFNMDENDGKRKVTVKFTHIMMSATQLDNTIVERSYQGAATIKSMIKWNPTAAYALISAFYLNRSFPI